MISRFYVTKAVGRRQAQVVCEGDQFPSDLVPVDVLFAGEDLEFLDKVLEGEWRQNVWNATVCV